MSRCDCDDDELVDAFYCDCDATCDGEGCPCECHEPYQGDGDELAADWSD